MGGLNLNQCIVRATRLRLIEKEFCKIFDSRVGDPYNDAALNNLLFPHMK